MQTLTLKIRYRPGRLNADADSLSRLPRDFHTYMDSCTEKLTPESLHASVSAVQTLSNGDSIWLTALTDEEEELHLVDAPSLASCNQVRVVDLVKAQKEDPHIGRVLELLKANHKPTVKEKYQESPLARKFLNEWHKFHVHRKSGLLYRNQQVVLPLKFRRTVYRELHEEMGLLGVERCASSGSREILLATHEERCRELYPSRMPMSKTETSKSTNKRTITANYNNGSSSNGFHRLCAPRAELRRL